RQRLSVGRDRGQTQGQCLQQSDSSTRSAQPSAVFGASASEPRKEPNTRSHRACVRSAAERAGRSDRANDRHRAGARQDRLAEPDLQHSPPGDAGTARRGMKTGSRLQCSNRSSGRKKEAGKTIENRTQPELVPNQASKSNIVRGALEFIFAMVLAMALTILAITTWAAPRILTTIWLR